MDSTFFAIWIGILLFNGILLYALTWAATSPPLDRYRIRPPKPCKISKWRRQINTGLNNLLALLIFIAFLYHLGPTVLYAGWPGAAHFFGETLGVLLLYDFMYYLYHRGLHHPKLMKHIHGVHHFIRHPTASESIFIHPLEQIGALSLLIVAMLVLGPISTISFLAIFFIYSTVNIIVHANVVFPHPGFRMFNFWVEKHDIHHDKVKHNYASIFPFWDLALGTYK